MSRKQVHQLRYKLHNKRSNNQTAQLAIGLLRALEQLIQIDHIASNEKTAVMHMDSQITLDLIKNYSKHNNLCEKIRDKLQSLQRNNWEIHFSRVKAYIGNEMADRLAKEAATSSNLGGGLQPDTKM